MQTSSLSFFLSLNLFMLGGCLHKMPESGIATPPEWGVSVKQEVVWLGDHRLGAWDEVCPAEEGRCPALEKELYQAVTPSLSITFSLEENISFSDMYRLLITANAVGFKHFNLMMDGVRVGGDISVPTDQDNMEILVASSRANNGPLTVHALTLEATTGESKILALNGHCSWTSPSDDAANSLAAAFKPFMTSFGQSLWVVTGNDTLPLGDLAFILNGLVQAGVTHITFSRLVGPSESSNSTGCSDDNLLYPP